jgi:6-phosphogluconate dehydrogenase
VVAVAGTSVTYWRSRRGHAEYADI